MDDFLESRSGMTQRAVSRGLASQAESDGLAAALVASAADAIIGMDRNGVVTLWNRGCEALVGWSATEMLGTTVEVLIPPHRRGELARVLAAWQAIPRRLPSRPSGCTGPAWSCRSRAVCRPSGLPVDPAVLNRVADLSAAGASFTTIAAALNANRQLTAGGKRWTSRTVAQLMATRPLH